MKGYLRNTCFVMVMLFFSASSEAVLNPPVRGTGYFEKSLILELDYEIIGGRTMIRAVSYENLPWQDEYPCEAIMKKYGAGKTFKSCFLVRNIRGRNEEREYFSPRALTTSELNSFLKQTGDVGPADGERSTFYALETMSTDGFQIGSSWFFSRGTYIPPIETTPPLSCSVSNGNINYDTLTESDIEGKKAKTNVVIYCNNKANVRLVASQYNHTTGIAMGSSGALASTLTINGTSAATGRSLTVPASISTPVVIEATLRKRQATIPAGTYKGMVVLTLSSD